MVHILFDPSSLGYANFTYFQRGAGRGGGAEGVQTDSDIVNGGVYNTVGIGDDDDKRTTINLFKGSPPFQRGYGRMGGGLSSYRMARLYKQRGGGISDILRGLWRLVFPVIKKAGYAIGREGLSTGERILEKIVQGEPIKESIITEGKRGMDNVLVEGGLPKQFGTGKKKGRKIRYKHALPKHQIYIGRSVVKTDSDKNDKSFTPKRKRIRSDTFGLY